jgi:hypothetical protein
MNAEQVGRCHSYRAILITHWNRLIKVTIFGGEDLVLCICAKPQRKNEDTGAILFIKGRGPGVDEQSFTLIILPVFKTERNLVSLLLVVHITVTFVILNQAPPYSKIIQQKVFNNSELFAVMEKKIIT